MVHILVCVALIGMTAGALGVFALLRGYSLLGDAIAHAALPGIACAFLLTHSTSLSVLLSGGAIAGCIGTLLVWVVTRMTPIKHDAILGIVLSVFFGFGLVLLTIIQKYPYGHQAMLNKFLFGCVATILYKDVYVIAAVSCMVLIVLIIFWKEFKLLVFDRAHAQIIGYKPALFELLLTLLCVCTIVIGLQTVGVVLMSSLFIAPAAAARQWTNTLSTMVVLAMFFGLCAGMSGALLSWNIAHLPTGPIVVIIISCIVFISLFCAPQRGIVWQYVYKKNY